MQIETLNRASEKEAYRLLFHCCGSEKWARRMAEARPFPSQKDIVASAEAAFAELGPNDWLEAFSHHPKIGDVESLKRKFRETAHLAGAEQSGVRGASEQTIKALADGNAAYEKKFGFIFIVCATGKSADEMLTLLQARLPNQADAELKIAAGEQKKITLLRLEKI